MFEKHFDRIHRGMRVRPFDFDLEFSALTGAEHDQIGDAAGVDRLRTASKRDGRTELLDGVGKR